MYGLKSKNLFSLKICPKTFFYQLLHYPFLGNLYIRFFTLRFFHASYAIHKRYQCFNNVDLTLNTVTNIHRRQLKNKIQLETWKQHESCQKIQDPRQKERNQVDKVQDLRKKNNGSVSWKNLLIHHLQVILIQLLKDVSSEIIYADVVVNE